MRVIKVKEHSKVVDRNTLVINDTNSVKGLILSDRAYLIGPYSIINTQTMTEYPSTKILLHYKLLKLLKPL